MKRGGGGKNAQAIYFFAVDFFCSCSSLHAARIRKMPFGTLVAPANSAQETSGMAASRRWLCVFSKISDFVFIPSTRAKSIKSNFLLSLERSLGSRLFKIKPDLRQPSLILFSYPVFAMTFVAVVCPSVLSLNYLKLRNN